MEREKFEQSENTCNEDFRKEENADFDGDCSFSSRDCEGEAVDLNGIFSDGEEGKTAYTLEKKPYVKNIFSRTHLAAAVFVIVSQVMGAVISAILGIVLPESIYENGTVITYINMGINVLALYLTAFPIFAHLMKKIPKASPVEKSRMGFGEFMMLFVISQGAMMVGSIIGNLLNSIISMITGVLPDNNINTLIVETPLWLLTLVVVIIGPIIEELMFRKLLIDRLSVAGDVIAILFSTVAFGIFHGNLYQFFYAAMVGVIFGYIYTKTRNVLYTIAMHMMINFCGSVLPMMIERLGSTLSEDFAMLLTTVFAIFQYSFIYAGVGLLLLFIFTKRIKLRREADVYIPKSELASTLFANPGVIIFYAISVHLMVSTIIMETLAYYIGQLA